ncbi:Bax inhibitor-1/YccA family protein [Nesterenkonia halotolerans]|uniref:Bax inhibitor-1/YccA family protein n=1 Tax=Nesterenkonia halotolerans TaxID=225325 RepID=UPI003EE81808
MSNPIFNTGAFPDQFSEKKRERRRFYMNDQGGVTEQQRRQNPAQGQPFATQYGMPGQQAGAGRASTDQLNQQYNLPDAAGSQGAPMTYDDVIRKTVTSFAVLLVGAAVAVALGVVMPGLVMGLALVAALVGFGLGLANAFKKEPSPALILAYSATQGFFLGAITMFLETQFPGIAVQAVMATVAVFGTILALFKSGKIRATPKLNKIFFVAIIGYAVFSLMNLGLMMFTDMGMFGLRSGWFGIAIGVFAILLASYSLVMDFTNIQEGVDAGVAQKYGWAAAFGLTVSLVWLYIEILRVIAIVRSMAE